MDIDGAFELLDKIEEYIGGFTMGLYNLLAMGLCNATRMSEAAHLVQDRVRRDLFQDKVVCSSIVEHFCKEKNLDYCLKFLKLILDNSFTPSVSPYCSLILGLRNEGKVQEAQSLASHIFRYANV
ncbi:hypothetical protein U1Q18_008157 [Sarracenia purpurea var. burkii]